LENKHFLWDDFCRKNSILDKGVSLFECDGMHTEVLSYGKDNRSILKRSQEMEALVIHEVERVITDFNKGTNVYEGLIYLMFWKQDNRAVPLYIGKSEKFGKRGRNLSENIRDINRNKGKFCRWGYNYAYHIGDLSAVVCEGHLKDKINPKYQKWAKTIFKSFPSKTPELKRPVYFWITAWEKGNIGPWKEFGETSLTFLEYLLIGLCSCLFPEIILNEEGVNR